MTLHSSLSAVDSQNYLESLIMHGTKLGLHNIQQLMALNGNPHNHYPVVHVAGTNGKGSVLSFLNAILRKAGYSTGCFTSPHLIKVNERFLVDDEHITNDELYEHLNIFKHTAENASLSPTYFEMNTAIAFRCFAEHKVDIALVEVGMGGRFDSTNIVEPIACSITTIDYDHTLYLGETLEKIAFEKAGIIKENVPVVVGDVAAAPMRVIEAQAQRMKSVLYHLNEEYHVVPGGDALHPTISYQGQGFDIGDTPIGLAGVHQVYNAAVAITLASLIRSRFTGITPSVICEALKTVSWPGRLEQVMDMPPVIIDVAHNPAGCRALADTLPQCVTVFSVSSDKDAAGMIDILAPISYPLILTEYAGGRSLALDKLESLAVHHPYQRSATLQEAIQKGLQFATPEKPLLITGSIYAVGEARRFLLSYANARSVVF